MKRFSFVLSVVGQDPATFVIKSWQDILVWYEENRGLIHLLKLFLLLCFLIWTNKQCFYQLYGTGQAEQMLKFINVYVLYGFKSKMIFLENKRNLLTIICI
jgi:hypothetical protein